MFQRKTDFQGFGSTLEPVPQTGTIIPPDNSRGWDSDANLRPVIREQAVEATIVGETIISADLTITGNVISNGRVKLEGTIEGDMHCRSLVVGENASVTGSIIADEVSVYGRVAGVVRGGRVNLFATAHVEGDIYHQGIGIEMGTHYDGRLKWSDAAAKPDDATLLKPATQPMLVNNS